MNFSCESQQGWKTQILLSKYTSCLSRADAIYREIFKICKLTNRFRIHSASYLELLKKCVSLELAPKWQTQIWVLPQGKSVTLVSHLLVWFVFRHKNYKLNQIHQVHLDQNKTTNQSQICFPSHLVKEDVYLRKTSYVPKWNQGVWQGGGGASD